MHVGLVEFLTVAAYVVIFSFLWRLLAARWSDNAAGKGMAAVYS